MFKVVNFLSVRILRMFKVVNFLSVRSNYFTNTYDKYKKPNHPINVLKLSLICHYLRKLQTTIDIGSPDFSNEKFEP